MLTNLEVFTQGVTTPPIPIVTQDPALDAIQIKSIDGLGPVKATINTTQYGSSDGETLDGTFTPKRNIVLSVGLNPNWSTLSIEALRQILYQYFMPENTVRLRFSSTHMPQVEISGVVESCEPNIFAKDPDYQISIICTQPYFVAVAQTVITGVTTAFADSSDISVNYQGNIATGFVVDYTVPSGSFLSNVRIVNKTPITSLWEIYLATDSTQDLQVSTVDGNKSVFLIPISGGNPVNQLRYVTPGSSWPKLVKGVNHLQFMTLSAGGMNWKMSYYPLYGGL